MSDKLYGQCAICGGSLTADHKCWPIPPPTDKEWANESLRIALQNIQDAATKPLHVEIESLRSRLAGAMTLLLGFSRWRSGQRRTGASDTMTHPAMEGTTYEERCAQLEARLAEADALLREARTLCSIVALDFDSDEQAVISRIDAHLARKP